MRLCDICISAIFTYKNTESNKTNSNFFFASTPSQHSFQFFFKNGFYRTYFHVCERLHATNPEMKKKNVHKINKSTEDNAKIVNSAKYVKMKSRHVLRLFLMDELNDKHSKELQINDQKILDKMIEENNVFLNYYKPLAVNNTQTNSNVDNTKKLSFYFIFPFFYLCVYPLCMCVCACVSVGVFLSYADCVQNKCLEKKPTKHN